MKCDVKLLSSLEKVFFDMPKVQEKTCGSCLRNEIYSFQLAAAISDTREQQINCRIKVISELEPYISIYQVGYVPVTVPSRRAIDDTDFLRLEPGLFPDPLHRVRDGKIQLSGEQTRALWIAVEPDGKITGKKDITLQIFLADTLLAETVFTLDIIDADLPETDVRNTGWFHGDCIASLHDTEVMSEKYWEILEKYLAVYGKFGHNTILTPIFTPPLDTQIGGQRPTNQLIKVTLKDGEYSFDFALLDRWIDLCRGYGIRWFEISHLFTQWGAKHAPKIMATVEGEYKQLFGWDTDALSEEYHTFLDAMLPRLVEFLKEKGVFESCYFHISDEPNDLHAQQYTADRAMVTPYLPEERCIDALSSYAFYEKGIVTKPVVSSNHIHTFMENGVEGLWVYYCTSQGNRTANRFIAMPAYRNRVLGLQIYKSGVEGFLQWGYNFWYSRLSIKAVDPFKETCGDCTYQGGDAFVVYPLDEAGEVTCSTRLYVFGEAFQDIRALELLESLKGRDTALGLLREIEGYMEYPKDNTYYLTTREAINELIKKSI